MHNSFLGLMKDYVERLFANGLLEGARSKEFASVFSDAIYPGHLTKIPNRIRELIEDIGLKGSGIMLKADEWKRIMQMLPVALFKGWRDTATDAFDPSEDQVQRRWEITIYLCRGLRGLHARRITYNEARSGVDKIAEAAKGLLKEKKVLKPKWHLAMHYHDFVVQFGPLSGWATWTFERHNGDLSRTNHNRKAGDISRMLVRFWMMQARLMAIASNPAPEADAGELAALEKLKPVREDVGEWTMVPDELNDTTRKISNIQEISALLSRQIQ
ncbi:hypothetical protein QFC21_007048 [Naganishia friedmannii]|uniref:Uncharacterized protein n=1 Tax=Naganishia friedmannii TaxID=89922 RepID=A0ACC2UYB6_9TREE|nr:hypothetical protein QFC21_007048 [Naganishia friedmannii]